VSGNAELGAGACFDGGNVEAGAVSVMEFEAAMDVCEADAVGFFGVRVDEAAAGIVDFD
jgi:hypothetical protein